MKRIRTALSALAIMLLAAPAFAHDFWADALDPQEGKSLTTVIGYGHNFPGGEALSDEQIKTRFEAPRLLGFGGVLELSKGADNKFFISKKPVTKGTYLVLTSAAPTFYTTAPNGSTSKPKNEVPGAVTCMRSSSFGKAIINVGGAAAETALFTKPVGQNLEIVPMANPAAIKPGQKFPVKVLFKGQPLVGATVAAYFAGFSDEGASAFSGRTNKDGIVNIIPLKGGKWLAKVSHSFPYVDLNACDTERLNSSLTFTIAD